MTAASVVVHNPLFQNGSKVPLRDRNQPIQAFAPYRPAHTLADLRPARHYPRFRIWHPSSRHQRDFNPPEQRAAQRTLWRGLTSPNRASLASTPRLPNAGPHTVTALANPEISRFPCKRHPCMPGSATTPGRSGTRTSAPVRVAFRLLDSVSAWVDESLAPQWMACTLPCRPFADTLADACARLGADVVCYSFIAIDLHHLPLTGLPAHPEYPPTESVPAHDGRWPDVHY